MNNETRPTKEMVMENIESATYTRLPSGTAIVCEMMFKEHRHVVHGIAKVCDMENYDEVRGKEAAYNKALDQAFEHMAWELHKKMATGEIPNNHLSLMDCHINNPQLI